MSQLLELYVLGIATSYRRVGLALLRLVPQLFLNELLSFTFRDVVLCICQYHFVDYEVEI